MALTIFWTVKIVSWAGAIFSLYSVFCPEPMQKLFLKGFLWKMKWYGFKGSIEATPGAKDCTRAWSIVLALLCYVLGNIVTIGYVLSK